jgi:hypothetical protein
MSAAILEYSAPHEVVPVLGLPTEQPAKRELTNSVDGVLRSITAMMTGLILRVIDAKTTAEFHALFGDVFPDYMRLLRSFSEVAATMPQQTIVRLTVESFNDLEEELRAHGEASFGPEMTERGLFTVFTLRKITPLLNSVITSKRELEACDIEKDRDFAKNFLIHALVSRFAVDCLIAAMDHNRTIYPDVLAALDDLMRAVVNAYAWVRQAAELRSDRQAVDAAQAYPPLEDEDRQLLRESMMDLAYGRM